MPTHWQASQIHSLPLAELLRHCSVPRLPCAEQRCVGAITKPGAFLHVSTVLLPAMPSGVTCSTSWRGCHVPLGQAIPCHHPLTPQGSCTAGRHCCLPGGQVVLGMFLQGEPEGWRSWKKGDGACGSLASDPLEVGSNRPAWLVALPQGGTRPWGSTGRSPRHTTRGDAEGKRARNLL